MVGLCPADKLVSKWLQQLLQQPLSGEGHLVTGGKPMSTHVANGIQGSVNFNKRIKALFPEGDDHKACPPLLEVRNNSAPGPERPWSPPAAGAGHAGIKRGFYRSRG